MKVHLKKALLAVLLLAMPQPTKTAQKHIRQLWADTLQRAKPQPAKLVPAGKIRLSCYHLTAAQTDSNPMEAKWFSYQKGQTAQHFGKHCAISWDLMRRYNLAGGDTIWVAISPDAEPKPLIVTDATNRRWRRTIDVVEGTNTRYLHNEAQLFLKINNKNIAL